MISKLSNSVLQCLSGLERRDLHCGDGDLLNRVPWVHAHARCTVADFKCSKTGDSHGCSFLKVLDDHVDKSLESVTCCALGDTGGVRNGGNKILLGHKRKWGRK